MSLFLEGLRRRTDAPVDGAFPWSVPTLASLQSMRFTSPVTFLMGENGSGKSTLIEALAVAVSAVTVGAGDVAEDVTLAGARRLAAAFAISQGRPQVRMFFRAEDAFGFTQRVERDMRSIDFEVNAVLAMNARLLRPVAEPLDTYVVSARRSWLVTAKTRTRSRTARHFSEFFVSGLPRAVCTSLTNQRPRFRRRGFSHSSLSFTMRYAKVHNSSLPRTRRSLRRSPALNRGRGAPRRGRHGLPRRNPGRSSKRSSVEGLRPAPHAARGRWR